jgi:tRNA 2-thiocytidine biosynthesis protein TtcA
MISKIERKLLHYTGKAIGDYQMIKTGDKVLACLSGGKDSFAMVELLRKLQMRSNNKFAVFVLVLDKSIPGWNDAAIRAWLTEKSLNFEILKTDIYPIVKSKNFPKNSYCILCSRLRRGHIYSYAKANGFVKIALGHHRDDLISSLLMSIFYNGAICSMPPKLLTDDKRHIVIRPLVYCQERDIKVYAQEQAFPLVSGSLCEMQENLQRQETKELIEALAQKNPKIPSNMLHALQKVTPSQLMDQHLWKFRNLEDELTS